MKKLIMVAGVFVMGLALMSMNEIESIMLWDSKTHDFGQIDQNITAEHTFSFVNEGETPLVIASVKASCGCTVAEYTKEPIAPGATGEVLARYNAAKAGVFSKTVTVRANANEESVILTLKGEVVSTD